MANVGSKQPAVRQERGVDWYMRNSGTADFLVTQNAPDSKTSRHSITQVKGYCVGPVTLKLLKGIASAASVLHSVRFNEGDLIIHHIDERYWPVPLMASANMSVHASLDFNPGNFCDITLLGYEEVL